MGDKNVVDPAAADLVFAHLHLCTLTAIHQEKLVVHGNYLRRRMPVKSRNSRIIS